MAIDADDESSTTEQGLTAGGTTSVGAWWLQMPSGKEAAPWSRCPSVVDVKAAKHRLNRERLGHIGSVRPAEWRALSTTSAGWGRSPCSPARRGNRRASCGLKGDSCGIMAS